MSPDTEAVREVWSGGGVVEIVHRREEAEARKHAYCVWYHF